jgi:hypothetical protein
MHMNIWEKVTNEDEVRRAEELVAAAIGVETDPDVLVDELRRTVDRLISGTSDEIADKVLAHVAALVGVTRGSLANTATVLAEVQGMDAEDIAVTRPIEVGMLDAAVEAFLPALGR